MLAAFVRTSSRLLIFGGGLLLGIQVPAFVDQYSQRVDAHYREVSANISGFKRTADELFQGDMQALINYYRQSNDLVFERDAESLQNIVNRYQRIGLEQEALQADLLSAALHVIFSADAELLEEARAQYSYTVPLDTFALQWGFAAAVIFILLSELTYGCCAACIGYIGRRKHSHNHKHTHQH